MRTIKDKFITLPFLAAAILLLITAGIAFLNLWHYQGLLIIHFDSYRGADFFGQKSDVYSMLGIALVALVINGFLADEFYWRERFVSYIFSFGTLFLSLLILIGIIAIISVN